MTRRRWLLVVALGVVAALVVTATVALVPRHDEAGDVDAVIVLGGGGIERFELGTAIATRNGVPLVLSAEGIAQGEALGVTCDVEVLCIHPVPVTTAGEAATMRELADEHAWERIAVATSSFHVNRSRMLFRQCFGDRVDVVGAHSPSSGPTAIYRTVRELAGQLAAVTLRPAC